MTRRYTRLNDRVGSHDPWPELAEDRGIDIYRHEFAADLIEKIAKDRDLRIIDVGCGDGILLGILHNRGYTNLHGTDHSRVGLMRTQRKVHAAELTQLDLTKVTTLGNHFDVAVCTEVLEHLPSDDDVEHAMKLIHDCLKDRGWVIISVPDDTICNVDDDHRRLFLPGDEAKLLHDAGFVKVQSPWYHYSDEYPIPWMYAIGMKFNE